MTPPVCPPVGELRAYLLGELSDADCDELAGHVQGCPECQGELATVDDREDTLLEHLRLPRAADNYSDEDGCRLAMVRALSAASAAAGEEPQSQVVPVDSHLGEYRVLEVLGRGGMGTVYRALHTKLDREVALKLLPRSHWEDDRSLARFEQEMQAIGRLDHPHIVAARDAREIEGVPTLIMEYVDGLDAGELVRRLGRLPVAEACCIARHIALALQYAHEHGLVHRDVKPSNIIVSRTGTVKLLDLGLARFQTAEQRDERLTNIGQAIGTADYIAPEQVTDSSNVDIRADIYSLGCTLYRLLSGCAPYDQPEFRGAFDKMTAHVSQPAPSIREQLPGVPQKLATLIATMLAKSPQDRPETPGAVAAQLEAFCRDADLPRLVEDAKRADPPIPLAPTGPPEAATAGPILKRRISLPMAAAAMLLFGVVGFALGIVITIKHADGRKTTIDVPPGSGVAIDAGGNVEVTPPGAAPDTDEAAATQTPEDHMALQGVWESVWARTGGDGPQFPKKRKFVFYVDDEQPRIQIWENDTPAAVGTYSVNPRRDPKEIGIQLSDGSKNAIDYEGIYEFLSEGRLTLCFAATAMRRGRPTHFRPEPLRHGDFLVELRLERKSVAEFAATEDVLDERIRERAWQLQSRNALKQIAIAMHKYHDKHRAFPPAFIADADGKPLLSWRVLILPFIERGELFEHFHLDEPWDSPHNLKLAAGMPDLFRAPGQDPTSSNTSYLALVGPDAVFTGEAGQGEDGKMGTQIRKIRDGTSNTMIVVQSNRDVPWTKPEDISFEREKPIPSLGPDGDDIIALFADGAVRVIPGDTPDLPAMITKDGGEVIQW